MSEGLTQTEEEAVLERYTRNALLIKELEAENEALKGFFKGNDLYKPGTTVERGRFYVRVSSNTRIDDALAKANLTSVQYRNASKTVIDPVKARRYLDETKLAKITKVYDNRIEIGLV